MTVISVSSSDPGGETMHWKVPTEPALNASPIPRGVRLYGGTVAVPILGAGDETNVTIIWTVPTQFIYLIKSLTLQYMSDDATSEFGNLGSLEYQPGASPAPGIRRTYELTSGGQSFRGATNSLQVYRPVGTWRQWINGPNLDQLILRITDMSMDASAAGDVNWTGELWEYDIEQCFNWQINTPQPQFSY